MTFEYFIEKIALDENEACDHWKFTIDENQNYQPVAYFKEGSVKIKCESCNFSGPRLSPCEKTFPNTEKRLMKFFNDTFDGISEIECKYDNNTIETCQNHEK